jgi:hypothetical protein
MVEHGLGFPIPPKLTASCRISRDGWQMTRKKTLNARRLTKREVQALITSGARPRRDLSAALEETFASGYKERPLVFELEGDRYLYVFDEHQSGLGGKGDIYPADYFLRMVRWTAKVREDSAHWRNNSTSHWAYYSQFKHELLSHLDMLVEQLRSTMARSRNELDLSYKSLDIVSKFVEGIGVERAQKELYDHLVAYVGEVLRLHMDGRWEVDRKHDPPFPYLVGPRHRVTMPINVVWGELGGLDPVNLRAAAANELRRTRDISEPVAAATSARVAPPLGALGTLSADKYEITKRWADGRPAGVVFKTNVEVSGLSCQGEAWFNRKGELTGATLFSQQLIGTRGFSAGSFVCFQGGRLANVRLGEDQEVDGLPCRKGVVVMFDGKERLSFLELAGDYDVEGIPCAGGHHVEFQKGRLSVATLAREHVLVGRKFPRGTQVFFVGGHLSQAILQDDFEIDTILVQAGSPIEFYENGKPKQVVLARTCSVLGKHYARGTLLQFEPDGNVSYAQLPRR